jgi:hypothetical protein
VSLIGDGIYDSIDESYYYFVCRGESYYCYFGDGGDYYDCVYGYVVCMQRSNSLLYRIDV